jgi:hypothetical protein
LRVDSVEKNFLTQKTLKNFQKWQKTAKNYIFYHRKYYFFAALCKVLVIITGNNGRKQPFFFHVE